MKKGEVQTGEVYAVKVSGNVVPVVLDEEHPKGGWVGTNQETNRQVRIKNAGRLRCPWDEYLKGGDEEAEKEAPTAHTGAPGEKTAEASSKGTKAKKKRTRAKTGDEGEKKLSGLDAAAKVLAEADEPLNCKAITERAFEAGYWSSEGQTPHATVYSSIIREIANKGDESRFVKVERGKFALAK